MRDGLLLLCHGSLELVLLTARSSRFRGVQGELGHGLTAEHDRLLRHLYHGGLMLSRRVGG